MAARAILSEATDSIRRLAAHLRHARRWRHKCEVNAELCTPPDAISGAVYARLNEARARVANEFLCGRGAEIGGGLNPHPLPKGTEALYYDVRSREALQDLFKRPTPLAVRSLDEIHDNFPLGCDFLIAHHVLEHSPDPISTLASWHRCVRTGGTIVLSVPDYRFCPDKHRVIASVEHLLLDFALRRTDRSFESKEHIAPFILGWQQEMWIKNFTGTELAEFVLSEQRRDEGHDLHWHAFTRMLCASTVVAACLTEGRAAQLLAEAHPDESASGSPGDIVFVYRIGGMAFSRFPSESYAAVNAGLDQLEVGLRQLQEVRKSQLASRLEGLSLSKARN